VVEISIAIDAVMAGKTVLAKIKGMGDDKIHVEGSVAVGAGLLIKSGNTLNMTVTAGERLTIRSNLVPGK
jgi:hypothetical protein